MEQACKFTTEFLDELESGDSWDADEAQWEKTKALNLFFAGAAWREVRRRGDSNKQLAMFGELFEQLTNVMKDNRRQVGG